MEDQITKKQNKINIHKKVFVQQFIQLTLKIWNQFIQKILFQKQIILVKQVNKFRTLLIYLCKINLKQLIYSLDIVFCQLKRNQISTHIINVQISTLLLIQGIFLSIRLMFKLLVRLLIKQILRVFILIELTISFIVYQRFKQIIKILKIASKSIVFEYVRNVYFKQILFIDQRNSLFILKKNRFIQINKDSIKPSYYNYDRY
ncbi:transmembrane protein, putative (macronuclear) [Tetrahymena thermophila SB210]|uniref:Transmembrane protein, putative n=1 Tax=Tetrahymena thermophila (strain SB210) TaxID=312017 RepID=W7X3B3_TETTS|nr:transmembrane protein, putative [Tetrahymena thermophila SB210]EWS73775.1 transmembrane protein, putative [Tetrahymena thermophila SB210]|eukprot:XP_012653655.1 transmembrane protein, putative [Tetrahymena thermophila SB210]